MILKRIAFFLISVMVFVSCSNTSNEAEGKRDSSASDTMNVKGELATILDEKKNAFNEKADSTKKRVYAEGIQSVIESRVVENAKQVGDTAPNFTLKNALGNEVELYDELKKGPVVLMWYRGGWCPYCNITLHHMQKMLPEFKKNKANLIALTPEIPDKSMTTKEKNDLEFEILSDAGNKVAKGYGVSFKLTDDVADYYENGFGLSDFNGNEDNELPLGATYVINSQGIIVYAFLDADYRNRAEPSEVLEAVENIK
jgi:peroxiredoxin